MTRIHVALLSLVVAATPLIISAEARGQEEGQKLGPSKEFLIYGQIMRGWIVEQTDSGFSFKVDDKPPLDVTVENIPWEALPEFTLARIRRATETPTGLSDDPVASGINMIDAVKYTLTNGRVMVGLPLIELATEESVFIKTKYASRFRIATRDIKSFADVKVPETEMYSLDELKQKKFSEINPTQGREYMEYGNYLRKIGHYAGAKDAFERAKLLEPMYEEAAMRALAEVETALRDETAKKLADQAASDIRSERYDDALLKIKQIQSISPDSPHLYRLESQIPGVERRLQKQTRRRIVNAYYQKLEELVRVYIYGQVVDGESIPGVTVTTKSGDAYTGILKNEDDQFMEIDIDGRLVKIERPLVVDIAQRELNPKRRASTFAEAKQFVQDTAGGLAAAIGKDLEEQFKDEGLTQDQIKEFWDDRLTDIVEITRNGRTRTEPVYQIREAAYGKATWLREGETAVVQDDGGGGRRQKGMRTIRSAGGRSNRRNSAARL